MKKFKKLTALALTATMALSMAACGSGSDGTTASGSGDTSAPSASTEASTGGSESKTPKHEGSEPRTIKIGTWFDIYYDSTNTDVFDDPSYNGDDEFSVKSSQMELDKLHQVEEKYNIKLEFVNLTYEGITESINTSVLSGKPDCDIYMVNSELGIPAIANGYAIKLEDVLPADADVLTTQNYLKGVKLQGIDGTYFMLQELGEGVPAGTYPLAFNKQMLEDAGLEDPNALYARGEWTWDKWREYLLKLTQDKDGDGVTDVYGFGTRYDFLLDGLNFSNGTTMMNGKQENLSSKEVGETLDFINKLYNVDHVARPWNEEDFNDNQNAFQTGQVACWVTAQWISSGYIDLETGVSSLGFDEIWCPWPIGPSGNKDTNSSKNQSGSNFFILPTGVEDPYLVYCVLEEYSDWYGDDFSLRDYVNDWWHTCADMKAWKDSQVTTNYQITYDMGTKTTIDLWNGLGVDYQFPLLLKGEMTPAQFQETNKQLLQTAMDNIYK